MTRIDLALTLLVSIAFLLANEAQGYPKRVLEKKKIQVIVHGKDLNSIRQRHFNGLSKYGDGKKSRALDIWIRKHDFGVRRRIKRGPPLLDVIVAATNFLRRTVLKNIPPTIKKGARGETTEILFKKGGYETAKDDFSRFQPSDAKEFTGKNGQEGMTGNILDGKYTVTARKTSTHNQIKNDGEIIREGSPTLEIRNNVDNNVLKIRYIDELLEQSQLTEIPKDRISLLNPEKNGLELLQKDAQEDLLDQGIGEIPDISEDAVEGIPDSESNIDLPDFDNFEIPE